MKKFLLFVLSFITLSAVAQVNIGSYKSVNNLSNAIKKPGIVYDADYKAVLARATALGYALPTIAQQAKQNKLLKDLKAGGQWALLDVFYVFATNGSSDFATINWKAPTLYQATKQGGIAFTSGSGFMGDGISSHLNTNFNPVTNGVNYTQNSASRGCWLYNDNSAGSGSLGTIDGVVSATSINNMVTISSTAQRINQNSTSMAAAVALTGTGMKMIIRTSSTSVSLYNQATRTVGTAASSSMQSESQVILRRGTTYGTIGISIYWMGGNLDALGTSMNTILTNYMSTL